MALQIAAEPAPLEAGSDGAIRVHGSRVTLDTIVSLFCHGVSAEEIQQRFSTVSLADVYGAIAYYLRHRAEVDAYVEEGRIEAERLRALQEARFPSAGIRERLMARKARRAAGSDASSGGG